MDAWKHCDQCDTSKNNIKLLVRTAQRADWKMEWTGKEKKHQRHRELQSEAEQMRQYVAVERQLWMCGLYFDCK